MVIATNHLCGQELPHRHLRKVEVAWVAKLECGGEHFFEALAMSQSQMTPEL